MIIELKEFPTHLAKTDNKYKANKMQKINNQSIYNGSLNRFARNIVMNNMHEYLVTHLLPYKQEFIAKKHLFPLCVHLKIHTVINHGDISMRSGKLCWKKAPEDYTPTWDIDNLATIWMKGLKDSLPKAGFITDDNVSVVNCGSYQLELVENIEDRKLVIEIE